MTLFTKEMMWECAVKQMGTELTTWKNTKFIGLYTPEDVEELYNALKQAHGIVIEQYERNIGNRCWK